VLTDPIADMLTRIRNANRALHDSASMPTSRMKEEIARILKDEGYIKNFKVLDDRGMGLLRLYLKYDDSGNPVIHGESRVSKPGRRIYKKKDQLPEVLGGLGIAIVSTSQGLLTGQDARRRGLGGEVVCSIW
jgi:small subunit ribosomal protein S8